MLETRFKPRGVSGQLFALLMLCWLWAPSPAQSAVIGYGVTGKAGTTGLGLDLTMPMVTNWLNLRLGYNNLSFVSPTLDDLGGIDYKSDFGFQDAPALVDLHPLHGNLRLTAGVYWLDHQATLTATPTDNIQIGRLTFTPDQAGSLESDIQHGGDFGPYIGIGWGNAADDNTLDLPVAIGFSMDLGVIHVGNSDVSLRQVGGTVAVPQSELEIEAAELEDDLNDVSFYPVLTLGLHIRF